MDLLDGGSGASVRTRDYLRLATVLERMPIGIGIYERSGQLFYSNRLFGFRDEPHAPTSSTDRSWQGFDRDGAALTADRLPWARALAGEIASPGTDVRHCGADGVERWFAVSAVPLQSRVPGSVAGAVVVTQSLDERRRLTAELEASELRFRQFAENSRNALLILDPKSGRVEYASPSAVAILGEGLIDESAWRTGLHPDDREQAVAARRRVSDGEVQRFDYRLVDAQGAVVHRLTETAFPIRHPGRDHVLIGSIVEDISRDLQINLYVIGALSAETGELVAAQADQGITVKHFDSLRRFDEVADVLAPGCLLIDGTAPDASRGIGVAEELSAREMRLPLIVLGSSDLTAASLRGLIRGGRVDLLAPPHTQALLARAIEKAARALAPSRPEPPVPSSGAEALARLSQREREVMDGLLDGGTNKTIARSLGISPRTVELHRARLMDRLKVRTLSELLRLALILKRR